MPPIPDLVRDSKLDTHFNDHHTVHSYTEAGTNRRRISREERWKREKDLGQGSYGRVWLEKCVEGNSTGHVRAVKMVHKRQTSPKAIDFYRELEAVAKFAHPKYNVYFVKSFGWYDDAEAIYIAMEYCPFGDLHDYLFNVRLPPAEARELTSQILEGLREMHLNGFAHRDLKPANILIRSHPPAEWWVKLGDFGISNRAADRGGPSTVKGTLEFMAPELLGFGQPANDSQPYDYQPADMWALGEIGFRMLTGERTFKNLRALGDYCRGVDQYPSGRLVPSAGPDGVQFAMNLMAVDANRRMKASEALQHPWLKQASTKLREHCSTHSPLGAPVILQEHTERRDAPRTGQMPEASGIWSIVSNRSAIEEATQPKGDDSSRLASPPQVIPREHTERRHGSQITRKPQASNIWREYSNGSAIEELMLPEVEDTSHLVSLSDTERTIRSKSKAPNIAIDKPEQEVGPPKPGQLDQSRAPSDGGPTSANGSEQRADSPDQPDLRQLYQDVAPRDAKFNLTNLSAFEPFDDMSIAGTPQPVDLRPQEAAPRKKYTILLQTWGSTHSTYAVATIDGEQFRRTMTIQQPHSPFWGERFSIIQLYNDKLSWMRSSIAVHETRIGDVFKLETGQSTHQKETKIVKALKKEGVMSNMSPYATITYKISILAQYQHNPESPWARGAGYE
ncbi:kinase-like protein [Rhizodiscina lignyota]|uniref:Autophagy-related protein 1 n=1 Tax=Rhizodiscina lignyota TaxID=1504668 RepID=A0A9P4M9W5_9PEZI|nr:kinase-like protein [Rhizodiscina lignyota]